MGDIISLRKRTPVITEPPKTVFISKNDKTGWSINTSIALTCKPSAACSSYCYGLGGRIMMDASLQRQVENTAFFAQRTPNEITNEAIDIVHIVARQQNFLRMFGVGDLQPGSVHFINQMSKYALTVKPKFNIWVATRKFDLASRLVDSPNTHVMMSFDSTTPPKALAMGRAMLGRNFYAAWVRQTVEEVIPSWVSLVFEEHHGHGRPLRDPDPRTCPATIHAQNGGKPLSGACVACTYCFSTVKRNKGTP